MTLALSTDLNGQMAGAGITDRRVRDKRTHHSYINLLQRSCKRTTRRQSEATGTVDCPVVSKIVLEIR